MLKFFRLYQKYILAIGAVVLMIAFLIPNATSMLTPSGASQVIGRADGEKIRRRDLQAAGGELRVLELLSPVFTLLHDNDPMTWLLAVREADRLGLFAGPAEVEQLLAAMKLDEARLNQVAAAVNADAAFARQAVRHWIMVETSRGLILGETRTIPLQRLGSAVQIVQSYSAAPFPGAADYLGRPRLSAPLLRRFIVDQSATLAGKLLVIPAEKAVTDLPEPTEDQLQSLFDQHKSKVPGTDGSALGYRFEQRVKLEYLSIPFAAVLAEVEADEVEAIAYHESHGDQFKDESGQVQDYAAARDQVLDAIRREKATQRIDQMIRRARAVLMQDPALRQMKEEDGYKVIPAGYQPQSLRTVADTIEQEFAVRPQLHHEYDRWLNVDEVTALEGLGYSVLADRDNVFFLNYLLSARELEPKEDNPLVGLRLQVNVVSQPMRGFDGSRYLFRLVDGDPSHDPASLEEVRPRVLEDARRLAAYRAMSDQVESWKAKAAEQDLDALASQLGLSVIDLPPMRRVGIQESNVPDLPGVGRSAAFVSAVYQAADRLGAMDQPVDQMPIGDRLVPVLIEGQSALALARLDDYKPISQPDYEKLAASPQWQGMAGTALLTRELPPAFAAEALKKRTGYVSAFGDEKDEQAPADEAAPN